MAISVDCQQCAASFAVKDHFAGKLIRCPQCKEDIVVPLPKASRAKALPATKDQRGQEAQRAAPKNWQGLRKKLGTILLLVGGIGLQILGRFAFAYGFEAATLPQSQGPGYMILVIGLLLLIVGSLMFLWGCITYAEDKGYSRLLGLLGLLSICGLFFLWLGMLVADKRKPSANAESVN